MAELLNKDPVTYERERDNFLKDLKHFHETRGYVRTDSLFLSSVSVWHKHVRACPSLSLLPFPIVSFALMVRLFGVGDWIWGFWDDFNEWVIRMRGFQLVRGCNIRAMASLVWEIVLRLGATNPVATMQARLLHQRAGTILWWGGVF